MMNREDGRYRRNNFQRAAKITEPRKPDTHIRPGGLSFYNLIISIDYIMKRYIFGQIRVSFLRLVF